MPTNFLLSFTGSTGATTNFNAIDNVQVCSFKAPIPVSIGEPSIHHFELSYAATGLTCESSTVTIKACANAACTSLYNGEVTVNLAATNGASWVGGSSVTFTGGQTTKALAKTATGTTVLSVSSSSVGAGNNPVCYEGGVVDAACSMNFLDTGLRFSTIPNQVAGLASPSQVQLQVVQTNTQTGACVARVTPTSTVQFGYQCVDPISCISGQTFGIDNSPIASNPASSVTQYTDVTRSFNSSAATNFTINYSDVGKVKLYAKLVLPAQGTQPAITLEQQSNEFIVRPDRVVVSAVTNSTGTANPGTTSTGAGFVAAGEEFKIVLDVVNRLGALTPNFGRETTAEAVSISSSLAYPGISGVPCAVGTVNCTSAPSVSFNNANFTAVSGVGGRFENTTAKWLQVGSLNINGKLNDQDYLGSGDTASTNPSAVVGRFYPHHFTLMYATLDDGCAAGNFSYMDSASVSSNVLVQAMAADGSTVLTNYNTGANKAYSGVAAVSVVAENANNAQNLASRLETTLPSWVDGSWLWQVANTDFAKRSDLVPDGPYSNLQLGLAVTSERDNRNFNVLTMNPATNTDCVALANCNSVQMGSTLDIRYGRFMLENAAGPEDQDLPISLQSQYWNGSLFTQNLQDSCSSFDPANLAVSGLTTLKDGNAGPMVAGQNPFNSMFIPAPNSAGVATLQYQIPLQLQYMQFPWNGGTSLVNPTAEANFGRFRGNKRQIFWQERLN
jgi:MSHA biogenesis protein MshQ